MRIVLLALALLLCWCGPCQSARNKATCALEIIGNGFGLEGLKSVKLDCNGDRLVDVGIDKSTISEQHSRLFTGVNVSAGQGCQQKVSKGLNVTESLHWLVESLPSADWRRSMQHVRLRPLVYFCGDDDLTFNTVTVKDVQLKKVPPVSLWDSDVDETVFWADWLIAPYTTPTTETAVPRADGPPQECLTDPAFSWASLCPTPVTS